MIGLSLTCGCGRVGFRENLPRDAGALDAGSVDAGALDAGRVDAGSSDSGAGDDGGSAPPDAAVGCVAAGYLGHEYQYCDAAVSFIDATALCASLGMHLVRIDDAGEQAFVEGLRVSDEVWIGASDQAVQNEWRWADGTLFYMDAMGGGSAVGGAYVHWGAAEPNGAARENCGVLSRSGFWIDFPCDLTGATFCESP